MEQVPGSVCEQFVFFHLNDWIISLYKHGTKWEVVLQSLEMYIFRSALVGVAISTDTVCQHFHGAFKYIVEG